MQNVATNYNLSIHKIVDTNSALIQFNILEKSLVILKVVNENDQQIRLLLNEVLQAGHHQASFNYTNLSNGKYIVRLILDDNKTIEIENTIIHI